MICFPILKNISLSSICLCACFACTVNAEEKTTEDNLSNAQTAQPLLIDSVVVPDNESEITEKQIDGETITKDKGRTDKPINESTPQPPLIDAQLQPDYEAAKTNSETEQKINQENIQSSEQTIEATPQPPLIDVQPEPSYEPDTSGTTTGKEAPTPTTQALQPSTEYANDAEPLDDDLKAELKETKTIEQATKWSDTRPALVSADWLQLKSGEWLRGRIIAMQEDDLEFESDELKKLVIEWKKVRYIKSSAPYRLRFDDQVQAIGAIEITRKEVHVSTDYDDLTFDRKKLLTIASGKETEISLWTSKVTFSINVRRGNTDQTDFTSKITAKRQTILSRLVLDYLGNFTAIDQNETINNHRLNGIYNIFITRKMFLPLVSAEYFRDPFQNIDQRVYVGTGIGYTLIKTNKSEWQVTGGPAYQATEFASVQADQAQKDSTFTLILSTKFDFELNSKVDLEGSYAATLGDEATGNYSHHSIFTVETELTDDLDLDTSLVWDRTRQPVAEENGDIPEQDDFRFLIGLGYDL